MVLWRRRPGEGEAGCVCCRVVCGVRVVSGLLLRDTGGACSSAYLWGGKLGRDRGSLSSCPPLTPVRLRGEGSRPASVLRSFGHGSQVDACSADESPASRALLCCAVFLRGPPTGSSSGEWRACWRPVLGTQVSRSRERG